jgi:hypothetical protein
MRERQTQRCWTLAERAGHPSPDRLQHLLARAKWDTDAIVADLRSYVDNAIGVCYELRSARN